jgi:hypothetical protein
MVYNADLLGKSLIGKKHSKRKKKNVLGEYILTNIDVKTTNRFEKKGFKIAAMKMMSPSRELLENHYADLSQKPFFPGLIKYVCG